MNTLTKNTKQLEYILDAVEWESFLVKNYVKGNYSFTSFILKPNQRFEDLLKQMLPFLMKGPNYQALLKHQMNQFCRKIYRYEWKSISSITEILRLGELIFLIDKQQDNVINLLLSLHQSLPHVINRFSINNQSLTKRQTNEFRNFLSVIVRLLYFSKTVKPVNEDLNYARFHKVLVQNENAIFNPEMLTNNPYITKVNFYKYVWLLMYEPENWIEHLNDQLDFWTEFEQENQTLDALERKSKRRRKGILSANKALNLINDFRANNIISEQNFEEGIENYYSVTMSNFRKQYSSLFEQYLLKETHTMPVEHNEEAEMSTEGANGYWIFDDTVEFISNAAKRILNKMLEVFKNGELKPATKPLN